MTVRWLRLLVPVSALALPLLAMQGRDEGGEDVENRLRPLPASPPPESHPFAALVSDTERERGAPFLVPLGDGHAWLGALEWEAGAGDRVALRELDGSGAVLRTLLVQEAAAEIVRPTGALDRDGRLCVFWSELVAGAAQLRFARLEGGKFTAAQTLTAGPEPNLNVEATLHSDGQLWLAWESFVAEGDGRGSIDVVIAPLVGDALGPRVRVGDGRFSDLDPVVASRGEQLVVAWSRYDGRDFEIALRSWDPKKGELAPPLNVSCDGSSDDLHPALVVAPQGDLWLAWDRLVDSTRGSSLPDTLRSASRDEEHDVFVMSARVRGDRVELPVAREGWPAGAVAGAPRFSWMGGVPRLALAADGHPWIAYRYLFQFTQAGIRGRFFGEPVLLHRFGDDGWSRAIEVDESIGQAEEPALAAAAGGVICAGQQDRRAHVTSVTDGASAPKAMRDALAKLDVDVTTWFGPTGIFVAHVTPPADPVPVVPVTPVTFIVRPDRSGALHFHPGLGTLRDGDGAPADDPVVTGEQRLQVRRGEQRWLVWWGDLHRHSSISRCAHGLEPTPTQRWEFGRDVHLYDFMAMTDHAGQIDPFSWWQLDKMCWLYRNPAFCPLAGFECSTQSFGHQNVILDGRLTPLFAWASVQKEKGQPRGAAGLELLYRRLTADHAITIPHTSADTGRRVPFEQCDPQFCRLVEVYQALRGNYEFEGCLRQSEFAGGFGSFVQDALTQGRKLGFVASTDHGNGASFAGVLSEKLDVASLFDALKQRRTFGATVKGLFVDFRIDDAVMGEEVECAAPPKVHLKARGPSEIAEVVVFRNGRPWRTLGRPVWQKPESTVGATLVLDPPFKGRAPDAAWTLTLTIDEGEWLAWPLGRREPKPREAGQGFSAEGKKLTFHWPAGYSGFRPGELRVRLLTHRNTRLLVESGDDLRDVRVSSLFTREVRGSVGRQNWSLAAWERFDDVADLAKGLGVREVEQGWSDDDLEPGPAWYYARVTQCDGEMAWSSPIFVQRK